MSWKQPIDTDIYLWFGDDHLARDLFIHLLLRTRNSDMEQHKLYRGKPYKLKRGQCIFGRNEFSKLLRCSPSAASNALKRININIEVTNDIGNKQSNKQTENTLQNVTGKVTSKVTSDYTIITILNYDDLIEMNKQSNKQVTSKLQNGNKQSNTNKSVYKSVKSEKNKDIKHIHGEFKHVRLTEKENEKLINDFGEIKLIAMIKNLDEYIEMTGKKYKNHNLTLRKWENKNNNGTYKSNQEEKKMPLQKRIDEWNSKF